MPKFEGIDGAGRTISLIREEGYYFPEKMVEMTMQNDMKKKLHDVRNFKTRDDDLLLCAYMKSGMHWLWEIVSMLVNKTSDYSKNIKEAAMLDANTQEELDVLPTPRLFLLMRMLTIFRHFYQCLREKMASDMTGNIVKIAEFLKVSVTDELVENIADNCHIDKMRHATMEIKQDILKGFLVGGKPVMYRKGQVGDWKNWFTVAENEKFDTWLDKHLVNTKLKFKYSL